MDRTLTDPESNSIAQLVRWRVLLGVGSAAIGVLLFFGTTSVCAIGPFCEDLSLSTESGAALAWPGIQTDAVVLHPDQSLTYYTSSIGRTVVVNAPVRSPAPMHRLAIDVNAHNSSRLRVTIDGADRGEVTHNLPGGRLIWHPIALGTRFDSASRLTVRFALEGDDDGRPTTLYGFRLRAELEGRQDAGSIMRRAGTAVAIGAALFALGAWQFARLTGRRWATIAAIDATALWPCGLLVVSAALIRAGRPDEARSAILVALMALWAARIGARSTLVDQGRNPDRAARALLASGFVIVTLVFGKPIVNGDGAQYYAYARTTVIDRNLLIADEYRDERARFQSATPMLGLTPRGYDYAFAPVGAVVFWLPPLAVSHVAGRVIQALGFPAALDGYSDRYLYAAAATSWLAMFAGLLFCYQLCIRWFSRRVSLLAVFGGLVGSPLFANAFELPMWVHAIDFGVGSAFAYVAIVCAPRGRMVDWALMGFLGGLLTAIRQQNALLFVIPAMVAVKLVRDRATGVVPSLALVGVTGVGVAIGVFPQVAMNLALFGRPVVFHPIYLPSYDWPPQVWRDLISARQGLFFWTPLMLAAAAGLVQAAFARQRATWGRAALVAVVLQIVLVGLVPYGPTLIGARYFVNCTPYFVLGLAAFASVTARRLSPRGVRVVAAAAVAAAVWAIGLDTLIVGGLMDRSNAVPPAVIFWKQLTDVPPHLGDHLLGLSITQPAFSPFVQLGQGLAGDLGALVSGASAVGLIVAGTAALTRWAYLTFDSPNGATYKWLAAICIMLLVVSASMTWLWLGMHPIVRTR